MVTASAIPGNRKSQGREKGSVHRCISAAKLKVANFFFENREISKHTFTLMYFKSFGSRNHQKSGNVEKGYIFLHMMDESEGDFRGVVLSVFQNLQKP